MAAAPAAPPAPTIKAQFKALAKQIILDEELGDDSRATYSAQERQAATDWARQYGVAAATKKFSAIKPTCTCSKRNRCAVRSGCEGRAAALRMPRDECLLL
jgi:hypothetical protein